MGGLAFVSGLLGGFGKTALENKRKKHEEDMREVEGRKRILENVLNNPDTRPEDRQAILKILLTPSSGDSGGKGKGKGKGKQANDPVQQFMDMLGGMGTGAQATPAAGGGTGGAQGGSPAAPQTGSGSFGEVPTTGPGGYAGPRVLPPSNDDIAVRRGGGPVPDPDQQPFSVAPMPGASNGAGTTPTTNGKSTAPLSVKAMPTQGIFKTQAEKDQEQIDFEKRHYEEVVKPEKEAERKALADREDLLIRAGNEREDAKLKAQQERDDARQLALDTRMKSQEAFQERMARMREDSASNRQMRHDAAMLRLTDSKAADAMDKQAVVERQKNISETLKLMQQQLTSATGLLKSREAEAEKRGLMSFWKDAPDTKSAMEDVENATAAISYLTDHKTAVISGKEDMDEVTAKTDDILRNGQPQWSSSAWSKANPGKDVKAAELAAMKAGMKVVP
jgi:hypothetical protein